MQTLHVYSCKSDVPTLQRTREVSPHLSVLGVPTLHTWLCTSLCPSRSKVNHRVVCCNDVGPHPVLPSCTTPLHHWGTVCVYVCVHGCVCVCVCAFTSVGFRVLSRTLTPIHLCVELKDRSSVRTTWSLRLGRPIYRRRNSQLEEKKNTSIVSWIRVSFKSFLQRFSGT